MTNFGFIKEDIEENDYIFGGSEINREILQPDGQWLNYLPEYESQAINFESDGCPIFGTDNAIEIIMKKKFNIDVNYSERFQYNLIPLRPPGGSPHTVAENIRKNGLIEQSKLPMTDTFEEYITPTPMSNEFIEEGQKWLNQYEFKHEYLWKKDITVAQQHNILKEALQYSPVGISVTAWFEDNGVYIDKGKANNHWCVCVGYKVEENRFYPIVFDTYEHSIKTLDPNHNIEMTKSYYITKKDTATKKASVINWFMELISKYFI